MTLDDLAVPERGAVPGPRRAPPATLVVAWQNPDSRLISPVAVLECDGSVYRFRYLRDAPRVTGFQPFLSFPHWDGVYSSADLFPLFAQRIMSPRRPDYADYMDQLDLSHDAIPWEQLARSGGHRAGDTVQLFPVPTVSPEGRTRCSFLVHGIRHVFGEGVLPLTPGDELALTDDPANPVNPRAVLVSTATGQRVGYVPDLLLDHLDVLRDHGAVDVRVEHVNGPGAPPHLRLLAGLHGTAPSGYRPMTGPGWETFG